MPKFASAIDTQRIPFKGLIPEVSATAPASPVVGLLWIDTSVTPRILKVWDGASWASANLYAGVTAGSYAAGNDTRIVNAEQTANKGAANGYASLDATVKIPIAQVPTGTTATTVALGNDARFTDQRTPLDNSVTSAKIVDDSIVLADINTSIKDGIAATASLRSLGTGAAQAAAGNDARLSDQRTPLDNSVTGAKIVDGTITDIEIATGNKDGTSTTPSLRTLGTGATQALAGNTRLDQITLATAPIDFNGQRGINLGAPIANTDLARLSDVQSAAAGIDSKPSTRMRSATNVTIATPGATIDGVTAAVGDRVLLNGQTTTTENDIWIFNGAAAAMTRSLDTITSNTFVFVEEGSFSDSQWVVTNNGAISRGVTVLVWTQFGGATSYIGTANRITVVGNAIDISAVYTGQTSITTLGVITAGTWTGTAIALASGGTGATTPVAARTNLNVPQRGFASDVPAITAGATVTITHSLGTQDVIVQVREVATQFLVELNVTTSSTTQISLQSDIGYAASALRVVILPVL